MQCLSMWSLLELPPLCKKERGPLASRLVAGGPSQGRTNPFDKGEKSEVELLATVADLMCILAA
jgi:hypothetical protein